MIVSIAIVVLPVGAVADDQLALAAADRGHRVDRLDAGGQRLVHRLAVHHAGRLQLQRAALVGLDLAEAVDRGAERVDHAAHEVVADGDREDLAGTADRLALLDLVEVTEDDDADLAGVEVQGDAERAVLELEQLVGHRRGQAGDPRDAVAGLATVPTSSLLAADGLVVVDVLLERVADLLRTDRKLRHFPASSLILWSVGLWSGGRACRAVSRPACGGRRRACWTTVPSMTSSPISTRIPPTRSGRPRR